ncbi:guanosine-3',5'-bis(diphosphate) 3'-pyrophosphohydrolase [Flavobacterium araucananum]|uniref:Guanosine polyphosphate pyrophosphohydrolase n=1 Tax=Flavobacterium araucananum TaxID=946678 RepID=A0A227P4X5_9FLAO|nr:HD domain-containing protein [Flavobacterium araucananum]OXG04981.1 guanosine polyphosphate pyrophosphohydrolase [Flavobacterium araucananum]PWK01960.1 guanosine-3',5'-bis(diphosphate) 3'-pyrophosphohydrolase [Flavobacterium araucananum]
MELQALYQKTIKFAAKKHADQNQVIPGTNLPYVVHLSNVTMEIIIASQETKGFNTAFAIQVALLHDILEDTVTTFDELVEEFDEEIAQAVLALTKNAAIAKEERMVDSLTRIKKLSKEVWAVKLADRITNLQVPPENWSLEKIKEYHKQALQILTELKGGNPYLENRLAERISNYLKYCTAKA